MSGYGHSECAAGVEHLTCDGSCHSCVADNISHKNGNGSDHANVAANTSHKDGNGSDHSKVEANEMAINNMVSIVQASKLGVADNDTTSLVFDFVPSKIVLSFNGALTRVLQTDGKSTNSGHCVITITGTNTFTSNMNNIAHQWNDEINKGVSYLFQDHSDYIIIMRSGIGSTGLAGYIVATATWTTATKTLLITWQQTNTVPEETFVELVATA
ncbi:unnamed protein product, partial [marine sediment metagenome]